MRLRRHTVDLCHLAVHQLVAKVSVEHADAKRRVRDDRVEKASRFVGRLERLETLLKLALSFRDVHDDG